ncbi:Os05g0218981 [Oryza sativa Japonica Group]|uniref:Os05g0218981 protein n=1 Tax=Oryza sativa subsp. japonica TaxID=39947 RepID=A0A0P0WJH8_ORYSJ|nr:hypothetical protein EE612_027914 [Oryza sativa]BAS92850.1 Os05g0218981 [Oryza sativa Japonica Group]
MTCRNFRSPMLLWIVDMLVPATAKYLKCLRWHMDCGSSTRLTIFWRFSTRREERLFRKSLLSTMEILFNINARNETCCFKAPQFTSFFDTDNCRNLSVRIVGILVFCPSVSNIPSSFPTDCAK